MKMIWMILGGMAVVTGGGMFLIYLSSPRIPDKVEKIGSLDLVTHTSADLAGWNEGKVQWRTSEYYSLNYRHRKFTFEGRARPSSEQTVKYSSFNALITFPSKFPAVVVNVGDAINRSFYYLIRDVDGAPQAKLLTETSGGVSAEWLDADPSQSPRVSNIMLHRGRMEGGRFLLLGEYCVLDTETLDSFRFDYTPEGQPNHFKAPLSMSPDKRSFARYGNTPMPEHNDIMLVNVFGENRAYVVLIDRLRMRFNRWEELDRAWFDRHFEWKSAPGQPDQLVARTNFQPLPCKGWRYQSHPEDPKTLEYDLLRVKDEMFTRFAEFLQKEYHAEQLAKTSEISTTFKIGSDEVNVNWNDHQVGVWIDRKFNIDRLVEIGDRFDAVLKTGIYDNLFLPGGLY